MNKNTLDVIFNGIKEQLTRPTSPLDKTQRGAELYKESNSTKINNAREQFNQGKISVDQFKKTVDID